MTIPTDSGHRKHPNQTTPIEDRFWANVYMEPMSGCWLWAGLSKRLNKTRDQPVFNINGKRTAVYRWSYARFVGEIPTGLFVCHKCDIPLCVNPSHLFVGTAKDNFYDSVGKGRAVYQNREPAQFCKRGHEFTLENTRTRTHKDGLTRRHCVACQKIRNQAK